MGAVRVVARDHHLQSIHKLERLGVHANATYDPRVVAAISIVGLGMVFLATRIKRVPLPAKMVLAAGGITYPLYLLHMQLGYVIFTALAQQQHVVAVACSIVFGAFVLAYAVWRFFERSAHRSTQMKLTELAARAGFKVGVKSISRAARPLERHAGADLLPGRYLLRHTCGSRSIREPFLILPQNYP